LRRALQAVRDPGRGIDRRRERYRRGRPGLARRQNGQQVPAGRVDDRTRRRQCRHVLRHHRRLVGGRPARQYSGHKGSAPVTEALRWYQKAADQGFAPAQVNIGASYEAGDGVPQDYGEAMRWLRKAADQGYPLGQHNIGALYENGHGVEQDNAEAMRWYRMAADQGLDRAQYQVGVLYEYGRGVS